MSADRSAAPRQKTVRHEIYSAHMKATLIAAMQHDVAPGDVLADLVMTIEDGSFWTDLEAAQAPGGWRAMDVSHLGLPIAAENSLRAEGLGTAGDVADLTPAQIARIPNIAGKTAARISIALARLPRIRTAS